MNGQPPPDRAVDLSVIIVTYNSRDLTLACIRSVLAEQGDEDSQRRGMRSGGTAPATQTEHPSPDLMPSPTELMPVTSELIVVDNASIDGTADAVRALAPGTRVLVQASNLGFARGNNAGLAAARGRYLLLLNSDTEVQPGALAALVAFMDAHAEAGACGPMLLNPDGSLQPSGRDLPSLWSLFADMTKLHRLRRRNLYTQAGRDYEQVAAVGELSAAALLVRRAVYEQVGGLDPHFFAYYEDVDWCKRIGAAGWRIYYVPAARVMHHWQGTSRQVSELAYAAGQDSVRYYFRKHHGAVAALAVRGMLIAKEAALLIAAGLRRNGQGAALHRRMLRRALAPLQEPPTAPAEAQGTQGTQSAQGQVQP